MKTPEQIAREAAESIIGFGQHLPLYHNATQIILAAIREANRVTWVKEPPTVPGWYWWRPFKSSEAKCREVKLIDGGLSCNGWRVDRHGGEWSSKPIQEPE